jgi:lipoate-protein ligase A
VDRINCRLLPFAIADGSTNMAADESLLEAAVSGTASLRFYTWSPPTLSLGYFQPSHVRLSNVVWLRRPSGGGAIMHHHELTYCLAVPAGTPWQSGTSWLLRMHEMINTTLRAFSVPTTLHTPAEKESECPSCLCFEHFTVGDLMIGEFKVLGSAQRRIRGALMQHGSILLRMSPHTPTLPGIRELSGVDISPNDLVSGLLESFQRMTSWTLVPGDWTETERSRVAELAQTKYRQDSWNAKR